MLATHFFWRRFWRRSGRRLGWLASALMAAALMGLALYAGGHSLRVLAQDKGGGAGTPAASDGAYAPGVVLVGLRGDGLPASWGRSLPSLADLQALPLFSSRSMTPTAVLAAPEEAAGRLELRLAVPPGAEWASIAGLAQEPSVLFAEPDWIVHGAELPPPETPQPLAPSDPLFRTYQWGMQRVGGPRAWALGVGSGVQVAVIDSGIDLEHPDLRGRILRGKNYITPGADPQDDSGHGTHVSGIIAAGLDNGVDVAGLAPRALIDPRKALKSDNSGVVSNIALAIREAADAGARIINMSFTTPTPSAVLESAVNYAAGKGVLLVAAAGNEASSQEPKPVQWPAAYPAVIAVAATDRDDQRAYYSHTGPEIAIAAPGGLNSQPIYSTWPKGIYPCRTTTTCTAVGTSMSTAFVSGAAALLWGVRPDLSPVELKTILLETARKTGAPEEEVGAGRLDVQAAMRRAQLSNIELSPSQVGTMLPLGRPAYTQTATLSNPSGELLFWQAATSGGDAWLELHPSPGGQSAGGSIRYGQPAQLSFTISSTHLAAGNYSADIVVSGQRLNGSETISRLPVNLWIRPTLHRVYLSRTAQNGADPTWQVPDADGSQTVRLTDASSMGLLLPFTFTLESQAITTVRLYADGMVTFPASESVESQPVGCLPLSAPASQAIYAWWTDLDPSLGGTVRTFRSTEGAFVMEFEDVPTGGTISPGYQVTFQIALFPDGSVNLTYGKTPSQADNVVVGMEFNHSLLYAQVACHAGGVTLGNLPGSNQMITIRPTDLR